MNDAKDTVTPAEGPRHAESTATDRTVEALHRVDATVERLYRQRAEDPETLGDKILVHALPSLAGFVAGKLFAAFWDRSVARRGASGSADAAGRSVAAGSARGLGSRGDGAGAGGSAGQGLLLSLAFAAASAAVGAVVSTLSDRGSKAIVARRHRRTATRKAGGRR